eukprot:scaffold90767_cov78-Phaeocystis_antarctica.AAC.2
MANPFTNADVYPTRGARLHARRRAAVGRHQRGAAAHVEQRRMLGRHDLGVERRSIGSLSARVHGRAAVSLWARRGYVGSAAHPCTRQPM